MHFITGLILYDDFWAATIIGESVKVGNYLEFEQA
jgi:hypothetical protein